MSRKILWNRKKELKNFPVCIVWRKRLKVAEDYKEIKNYRLKNIRKVFKFYFDNMLSNKRDPKKEETSFSYEGSERWKNLKMNLTQLIFSFTVKWTQYKEEKNKRCHSPIQGRQTQHCHLSCCYCLCDQRYRESSPKSEEWDTKGKVVWNSQIPSRKVQRYFYLNLSILIDLPPPPRPVFNVSSKPNFVLQKDRVSATSIEDFMVIQLEIFLALPYSGSSAKKVCIFILTWNSSPPSSPSNILGSICREIFHLTQPFLLNEEVTRRNSAMTQCF